MPEPLPNCPECGEAMVVYRKSRPRRSGRRHSFGYTRLLYGCPTVVAAVKSGQRVDATHGFPKFWPEGAAEEYAQGRTLVVDTDGTMLDTDDVPF